MPVPSFAPPGDSQEKRPESLQMLQDRLRDNCLAFREMAARCQIQFKSKKSPNEQFNRLYYQPEIPFLQKPEKQKAFRNEFLADVSKIPEPKPVETIADEISAEVAQVLADCSTPSETR